MSNIPKCFISYSHDSEEHKKWVRVLATRLMKNGVDIILDQWDLRLGSDLPAFMESGLSKVDRVISICTENYVGKANKGHGGVGYEKMILTAELMKDINSKKVIPLIRDNQQSSVTPVFLSSKVYIDFRANDHFEASYTKLIKEIHGETVKSRPALGKNPFAKNSSPIAGGIMTSKGQYISPANSGEAQFDYDNNNGLFTIGAGDAMFDVKFSGASNNSIYIYNDPPSIEGVAMAYSIKKFNEIKDASSLDYTSRSRTPQIGEIVVLVNIHGFFAALKIEYVQARSRGAARSMVRFTYKIIENKGSCFE